MPPRQRSLGLLVASALCWSVVEACGVLVHNEVFHRSTHLFTLPNSSPDLSSLTPLISPLLVSPLYAPSFQAGAFFPDWGYQCLSTDDLAEAAHWPPFLVASVEHIVSKYGYLNDTRSADEQEHLEGLIAFIFAVSSHQTADATWHAIRLPSGFLAALAGVDFAGDITKAHRLLDVGGDFVLATRLARMQGSKDWIGDEWKVPMKDVIDIYKRIGWDANAFVLRYCTMRGLAALRSGLVVGPSLYDSIASQSPMLLNSLDDYHLGGIDEMSARTVSCWANLTRWFAHGIERDEKLRNGWGICDIFQAIKARGGAGVVSPNQGGHGRHSIWGEGVMLQRSKKEYARITVSTDKFGAEIYTLPPLEKSSADTPLRRRKVLSSAIAPKFQDPTYIATYTPYGQFGASLSLGAFSSSGPALAVGAPRETEDSARPSEGNVYILPLSDLLNSPPSNAAQPAFLSAPAPLSARAAAGNGVITDQRFGASTTPVSALGTTLLAIAAPGPYTYDATTPPSLPFADTAPAGRIDLFRPGEPSRFLALKIKGAELGSLGQRWWGESMISANLSAASEGDFLVVSGSRSDGRRVCEGRDRAQMGEGLVGVFQLIDSPNQEEAAELELELGAKGVGARAVTVNTWSITIPASEKTGVPCEKGGTYEYFGASLAALPGSKTLLIGAPGAGGAGRVYAYAFHNGGFELSFKIPSPSAQRGLRTGFGGSGLAAGRTAEGKEWIAIAAADEDIDGDSQAGVVRVYVLDGVIARQVAEVVAAAEEGGARKFGKFGRTLVGGGGSGLWVGSEYWDGERGAVWWVDVEALLGGTWKDSAEQAVLAGGAQRVEVGVQLRGEEPNARFATSLVAGPGGELFVGIPYSGVSREDQELRFYGAIAIFAK